MRVLVTGTGGRVGSWVAREFLSQGYEVRALDKMPPRGEDLRGRVEMVYADLTDRLAILKAAEGCDRIAHLAAIAGPGPADDRIFQTNVSGTQYILAAAEAQGIKSVALASTCCTFGIFYALHPFDPQYLPMDEAHPVLPQDLYALSKVLNEETAAAYTRRCGMVTVSLRLTSVMDLSGENARWHQRRLQHSNEFRAGDLWSYIDVRDAARAFRLAVEAPTQGSHVCIIAARDSFTPYDIRDLVRKHYPSLAACAEALDPTDSLYNTRRAEEVMGFVAARRWRDVPELAEAAP